MLCKASCEQYTEERIYARIRDFTLDRYGDSKKFVAVVKEFIERKPGLLIDRDILCEHLNEMGLFRLPMTLQEDVGTVCYRASSDLRAHLANIAGIHIPRDETNALEVWLDSLGSGKGVAALLDVAGSGKSVILHDLLTSLEARNIPVLAIKADKLLIGHETAGNKAMQEVLRLPAEPESLLAAMTRKRGRAVLIIDQLDALSMTFARDSQLLDRMLSMISRAAAIDGVAVVFSCRGFDRHFDPKIRTLAVVREIPIKPLVQEQIELVLNQIDVDWKSLSAQEKLLLQQPQHLDLFARINSENRKQGRVRHNIASVQDLYDELWNLVVARPPVGKATPEQTKAAVIAMADEIERTKCVSQPLSIFDNHQDAADYLRSAGIIRRDGPVFSFFHQSFFDYVFSRTFVAKEKSLVDYLRRSDQGLFERSTIVHILTHLRSSRRRECLSQVATLVHASGKAPIRYHLRNLTFAWFGQQSQLVDEERALGLRCLRSPTLRKEFLRGCWRNGEWFDCFKGELRVLFDSDDATIDVIFRYLDSVQDQRPREVYQMLVPILSPAGKWNGRIRYCVTQHHDWKSEAAGQCLLWFLAHDESVAGMSSALTSVAGSNPLLGCTVLRTFLTRLYDDWLRSIQRAELAGTEIEATVEEDVDATELLKSLAYSRHARDLIPRGLHGLVELTKACAAQTPAEYLAVLIPWVVQVCRGAEAWHIGGGMVNFDPFRVGFDEADDVHDRDPATELIRGIRTALMALTRDSEGAFLSWAHEIEQSKVGVLHQLLMETFAALPAVYAHLAAQYLLRDCARLGLGSYGDGCRYSGKLVGVIFRHLSIGQRRRLEKALLAYRPPWAQRADEDSTVCQLELLWDIPKALLTKGSKVLFNRLKRKLKQNAPRSKPDYSFKEVVSPLSSDAAESLSLAQWLKQMRQFNDDTGWNKDCSHFDGGGIIELSRQLEDQVSKHPKKYLGLRTKFDATISSTYHAAFLSGLAKSKLATVELFATAIMLDSQRPNDPDIQRACNEAVEKHQDKPIPDVLVAILRKAALESPNPALNEEPRRKSGNARLDDPFQAGINTVRGRAIRTYVAIALRFGEKESSRLLDTVKRSANDTSVAVRACLIDVLPRMIRDYPDFAQDAFHIAICQGDVLLDSHPTHEFIYWSMRRDPSRLRPLLTKMLKSTVTETRVAAGRLITLAWFETAAMASLFGQCIRGDSALREGSAGVLARNVDDPSLRKRCLNQLRRLFDDDDSKVGHSVGKVFDNLSLIDAEITRFTRDYVASNVISVWPDSVAKFALRMQLVDGPFALDIGERLMNRYGRAVTDHTTNIGSLDDDLVNISMTAYRTEQRQSLKRRAMDLFEKAVEMGSHYAQQALVQADR